MFWENFEYLCGTKNMKPNNVAKELGISSGTVTGWKQGTLPNKTSMKKIADFFGVTTEYFFTSHVKKETKSPLKGARIPVVGNVAAGIPIEAIEQIDYDDPDSWEEITQNLAETGRFFALRIHGDSMSPEIKNGDIVIVRCQDYFDNGDVVIVQINGDEATCKKIRATPEGMTLISINPNYDPMFFTAKQINELPVKVIGKVVEQRRKF